MIATASASTDPATLQRGAGSESERRRQSQGETGTSSDLPAPLTRLVGRGREVVAVRQLLAESRLVTLTGVGGTGKTRLALEVARQSREAFPGGTWFVNLAPIDDPEMVPLAIERRLRAGQAPGASPLERIVSLLGDQRTLLMLDNFEQVVEAGPVISALLVSASNLRVLATSRVVLHLYGEHEYRVPPLSLIRENEAGQVAQAEAVRLFVQAARAARPDFVPDGPMLEAASEICRRLDGLPLAIELAAARTRYFSLQELLTRLTNRLEPLKGGGRDLPERQQTLRRTFDWSYDLLTSDQRRLLARLGVFAGSFDASYGAATVADPSQSEDAFEALTLLYESGLLERASGPRDTLRFALLQTVREYALARLAEMGELAAMRARHAAHYLALAEEAAPALRGPEQLDWLARLEQEQDNLRAALQWAEAGGEAAFGLRLAVALAPFWDAHGHLSEGRRWLERLLALPAEEHVPTLLHAQALLAAGRLAHWQADLDEAAALLEESLELARLFGDLGTIAETLVYLGAVRRRQGEFTASKRVLEESLALYQTLEDDAGVALALLTLGVTIRFLGDAERSVEILEESLARLRRLGDLRWIAINQTILGCSLSLQGDLIRARRSILEGLSGHWAIGDRAFGIQGLLNLAEVLTLQDQPIGAARLLGAMDALCDALGASLAPANLIKYERATLAALRDRLSKAEFDQAWQAGQGLTLEQALAEATKTTSESG